MPISPLNSPAKNATIVVVAILNPFDKPNTAAYKLVWNGWYVTNTKIV